MNTQLRFILSVLLLSSIGAGFNARCMNNDGYPDLLWRNSVTRENRVWAINANANGGTPLPLAPAADADWKMVGTADFDGDGQLDIVWY